MKAHTMTNTKHRTTNKQYEHELAKGKRSYQVRKLQQQEQKEVVKDFIRCSCLDSAFERQAIDSGLCKDPVFPENKEYIKTKR